MMMMMMMMMMMISIIVITIVIISIIIVTKHVFTPQKRRPSHCRSEADPPAGSFCTQRPVVSRKHVEVSVSSWGARP